MSDNRKLAYTVHIDGEDGEVHVFGPQSDVPAWARKKITNPSAWADGDAPEPAADPTPAPVDEKDGKDARDARDGGGNEPPAKETYAGSEWTKAKLEAEVATRNEGRAEDDVIEVEAPGNKPDLIAALVADDVVQADNDA